ncbi:MAG: hypothetical protein J3K34DRAFT_413177 [Monoraphidium minutum]|nr:MAG: hypothetical protein J3K34DRAFT_413177 [Monoraphidium minutum]
MSAPPKRSAMLTLAVVMTSTWLGSRLDFWVMRALIFFESKPSVSDVQSVMLPNWNAHTTHAAIPASCCACFAASATAGVIRCAPAPAAAPAGATRVAPSGAAATAAACGAAAIATPACAATPSSAGSASAASGV